MSLQPSSDEEFENSRRLSQIVSKIPNFENFFVVPLLQCTPAPLTDSDLNGVDGTCLGASGPLEISQDYLNANLSSYRIIQMADGGITFRTANSNAQADWSFPRVLSAMCNLLDNGIVPMNTAGVLHFDLKDDNIVFDGEHVRLIDWDRALFLSDFDLNLTSNTCCGILTLVGQPVSYAFHVQEFFDLVEDYEHFTNEEFANLVCREVIRFHKTAEKELASACGFVIDDSFIKAQVLVMLNEFRTPARADGTWKWERMRYYKLLQYNFDVYGWLMLVLFLYGNAGSLFLAVDAARLTDPDVAAEWNRFFITYLYTPAVLCEPYEVSTILEDIRALIRLLRVTPTQPQRELQTTTFNNNTAGERSGVEETKTEVPARFSKNDMSAPKQQPVTSTLRSSPTPLSSSSTRPRATALTPVQSWKGVTKKVKLA
jgi:serine/threonine protein kinase